MNAGACCALFSPEPEGIALSTLSVSLPAQLNFSENRGLSTVLSLVVYNEGYHTQVSCSWDLEEGQEKY